MTDEKIEKLTPEQEAQMLEYREYWLAVGRSTEPADREASEAVFKAMYAAIGEAEPEVFWCDGPMSGSIIRALFKTGHEKEARAGNLHKFDKDKKFKDALRECTYWGFWGQHEASWPAFYMWPHLALRPMHTDEQLERLNWWLTLAKSCGWWHPYKGIVFACERPEIQTVDADRRLHNESGPALRSRDGHEVYAWHNVRVPEYVVMRPHEITAQKVLAENNTEVRAVMLQRRPQVFAEMPDVKVLHEDSVVLDPITPPPGILPRLAEDIEAYAKSHPRPESMQRKLIQVPMPDHEDGFVKVLIFHDPAEGGAMGALIAHKDSKTAQDAVARSYGLTPDEYPAEFESSRR